MQTTPPLIHDSSSRVDRAGLSEIIADCAKLTTPYERIRWFVKLVEWIWETPLTQLTLKQSKVVGLRLRFLIRHLQAHEARYNFFQSLHAILIENSFVGILVDIGTPQGRGFIQELTSRISQKIFFDRFPEPDLHGVVGRLYSLSDDETWLEALDRDFYSEMVKGLREIDPELSALTTKFRGDLHRGILVLVSEVQSIGLSSSFRNLPDHATSEGNPFYRLAYLAYVLSSSASAGDEPLKQECLSKLMQNAREARVYINAIHARFSIQGTSLSQMYLLMKCTAFLDRLDRLMDLDLRLSEPFFCFEELKLILIQSKNQNEVLSFLKDSARVIVQKVISRTSELGEHYISRTPQEYFKLFFKACGGGFVISSTVILKILISLLPLAAFPMGIAHGINYSLSFVVIYLVGFTVATKQPASTAPLLAQKISGRQDQSWKDLIDEIVNVFRSQFVSVAGNILVVVPSVALFHFIYVAVRHKNFISDAKALHLAESLDVLGPSWIYAIFTGFLLFLSSVTAGWADQWFQYNRVGDRILLQPSLLSFFGKVRLKRFTVFFESQLYPCCRQRHSGNDVGCGSRNFDFLRNSLGCSTCHFEFGYLDHGLSFRR